MATTTALCAMVVQKRGSSITLFNASFAKAAPCSRCYQVGPICCILEHHSAQSDIDAPRRPSRRDAIALFLQAALSAVLNTNAQAAERGFEVAEKVEHLQATNELGMRLLVDLSSVSHSKPTLSLGKLAGFTLAFQGAQKSSGSSLGLLGCLVFGLLFLKEKQRSATNTAALEDVQVRIKQAERELCSQTRSSVSYKLEESQLMNGSVRDTSQNETLQRQLVNAKFSIAEKGKQLGMKKDLSDLLRKQAADLASSIKELERSCLSLLERVDKQLSLQHELDAELQSLVVDLQCKDNEVCSLKSSVQNQEEANKEMVEKLGMVESSLKNSNKHVLDAEKKIESQRNILVVTDGYAESLSNELECIGNKNETSEGELSKLSWHLQSEQASFAVQLAEHKELKYLTGKEVQARLAELSSEQDALERYLRLVNQLTYERDELMMAVSEKYMNSDGFKEMLDVNQERLRTSENKLATLQKQLFHEQACRSVLESDFKGVLGPLLKVSLEVENQIKTQKDVTEKLQLELHSTNQALGESEGEISALQDTMQYLLSSREKLQKDMTRLNEERQVFGQAMKKEKRAAAYARKQLASSKEIMSEESQVLEELCNDLEEARKLVDEFKEQILAMAFELERVTERVSCITDNAFQSNSAPSSLHKEQGPRVNLGGSDEAFMSVDKPIRRRNTTKQATAKTQKGSKNTLVQPSQHK